jgi:phosphoribosylformylglycinamidine cyclo-ligase
MGHDDQIGHAQGSPMDYKSSGVDVEAGDQLVDWLQASQAEKTAAGGPLPSPHADKLLSGIGGFAAIFRLGQYSHLKKPCLVSSTDGIGTKIKLAADFQRYETVGQDLVAMCVNDLVCCGAEPLFFLDYYASGKLDLHAAKIFLKGVRDACHESGCALIGGETAEMPGIYHGRDFDAAGFSVGIVDEDNRLGAHRVQVGDQVLGVSSSGFHSNGFSLLRKVFEKDLEQWLDVLMKPTHLYAKLALSLHAKGFVAAIANITGGGMENIPRVLPAGTVLRLIDWAWPEPFCVVQDRTGLARTEMLKTLNCGIGLVLIVPKNHAVTAEALVRSSGYECYSLGTVEEAAVADAEAQVIY